MATRFANTTHRTRRPRKCYLCGESIPVGSQYVRATGIDEDNEFYAMPLHPECLRESQSWTIDDWETFSPGDIPRPKTET